MGMSNDFHQIRTVELTTNQLILVLAIISTAAAEDERYIQKLKDKEIEVHPGQLEKAISDREEIDTLRKAFRTALADIESTWGKE